MLNFENIRQITNEMKVDALIYAENFWQKIFDILKFDKDYPIYDSHEFSIGEFPDDADPNDFFDDMHFSVEYNCFNQITIYFYPDMPTNDDKYPKYRLLEEVLLKNGFVKIEDENFGNILVRNVI